MRWSTARLGLDTCAVGGGRWAGNLTARSPSLARHIQVSASSASLGSILRLVNGRGALHLSEDCALAARALGVRLRRRRRRGRRPGTRRGRGDGGKRGGCSSEERGSGSGGGSGEGGSGFASTGSLSSHSSSRRRSQMSRRVSAQSGVSKYTSVKDASLTRFPPSSSTRRASCTRSGGANFLSTSIIEVPPMEAIPRRERLATRRWRANLARIRQAAKSRGFLFVRALAALRKGCFV